jgi:PAS domain S-box-containing protein
MRSEVYAEESVISIDFFKTIISRMMNAFALHKIILDDEGKPCDYEFVDVNPSFEILTGLKKSEVLGKKVSEIIPNIREDEVDWIDIYGNVAISGESLSFDSFTKSLGKWYIINAYSPKKGYFVTVFSDISQMK